MLRVWFINGKYGILRNVNNHRLLRKKNSACEVAWQLRNNVIESHASSLSSIKKGQMITYRIHRLLTSCIPPDLITHWFPAYNLRRYCTVVYFAARYRYIFLCHCLPDDNVVVITVRLHEIRVHNFYSGVVDINQIGLLCSWYNFMGLKNSPASFLFFSLIPIPRS